MMMLKKLDVKHIEKIVGDVFIYNWKGEYDYVKIMNLAVHPDYRKQGLAHKLLNYVTEEMKEIEEGYFEHPSESAYKYVLQV